MAMRINKRTNIVTAMGVYHRAMETPTNIFYVNYIESDENSSVKMFDRKMTLVCSNYHGYGAFIESIEKKEYSWISEELKKNIELNLDIK